MVASSADRGIHLSVSGRLVFLYLHRRGAWYSPRHGRIHDGPVRTAIDSGAASNDAAVRRYDAHGEHAGLAAALDAGHQPDPAFCFVRPGCAFQPTWYGRSS